MKKKYEWHHRIVISAILLLVYCLAACNSTYNTQISENETAQISKAESTNTKDASTSLIQTITETPTEKSFYQLPTEQERPHETSTTNQILNITTTPYPIFFPDNIVTVTPAQPAICPVMSNVDFSKLETEYAIDTDVGNFVYEALSNGASFDQILSVIYRDQSQKDIYYLVDLTTDGVPELVIDFPSNGGKIIQCQQGRYVTILNYDTSDWPSSFYIKNYDFNQNGIPEILISFYITSGSNLVFDALEWNGSKIISIMQVDHGPNTEITSRLEYGLNWYQVGNWWSGDHMTILMNGGADITIKDIDRDGFKEFILKDNGPVSYDTLWNFGPWLSQEVIFKWNGESFLFSEYHIDEPIYRYQAVQEADRAFILREYERASRLYEDVINSITLEPWSLELMQHLENTHNLEVSGGNPDVIAKPVISLDEYQELSAYARYRLLMIHLMTGDQNDALSMYQMLDQIYTEENPGYSHAQIGRIYWAAFEDGMDLVEACQPVINYVNENPELLDSLGNQWHGDQSHIYKEEDICPLDATDVELLSEMRD